MKKNVFRKGLVIGIIILFIGAGIIPNISGEIVKKSNSEKLSFEVKTESTNHVNDFTSIDSLSSINSDFESYFDENTLVFNELTFKPEKETIKDINDIIELIQKESNSQLGDYCVISIGPLSKLISKVQLNDGPFLTKLILNRNFKRRLIRHLPFLPLMIFFLVYKEIDFNIEFLRNVTNNSRYMYYTITGEAVYDENGSFIGLENTEAIYSEKHSVTVENFQGVYAFKRLRFFLFLAPFGQKIFNPAKFLVIGFCDSVELN